VLKVKQPVPQLVPAGLGVAVPVAAATPAVDNVRRKLGMLTPHTVPSQVAVPVVGTGQATQELPQVSTLASDTHRPPQLWKPALHAIPQLVPLHVAVPLAGTAQGEQSEPQLCTLPFAAQLLPQAWKPAAHWKPHCSPSQVAAALAGGAHATQDVVPQVPTPAFATQASPHR